MYCIILHLIILPWQVFQYNRQEHPTKPILFPVRTAQRPDLRKEVHGQEARDIHLALGCRVAEIGDECTACYEILEKLNQRESHATIEDQPQVEA